MDVVQLKKGLYDAQKQRDTLRVSVLRFLLSAISNREIELRGEGKTLSDEDVFKVIKKQIKQRGESIDGFKAVGRPQNAAREEEEKKILEELLGSTPQSRKKI